MASTPTAGKPASAYHHGDLRNALLQLAWTHIERGGEAQLSLRKLAEELGVSHAAPAHHFGDKAGLLEQLQFLAWQEFAELLEVAGHDGLKAMGLRYVAHGIAHPRRMALMFNSPLVPWTEATQQQSMRAWQALTDAVARYVGPVRAADEQRLAALVIACWAQVHGLAKLWTETTLPPTVPTGAAAQPLHSAALDVLLAGLQAGN